MHREGHFGIAFLVYAPIAFVLSYVGVLQVAILGLVGLAFGAIAPDFDLDMPVVQHRGITHTFVAAVFLGLVYAGFAVYLAANGVGTGSAFVIREAPLAYLAAMSFGFGIGALGVCAHLLGDVITPMGITPYHPFDDRKYTLNLVYASNERANEGLFSVGSVAVVLGVVGGLVVRTGALDSVLALM